MDYSLVPIAAAVAASSWAMSCDASREPAQHRGGQIRFRPARLIRLAIYSPALFAAIFVADIVQTGSYGDVPHQLPAFGALIAGFAVLRYGLPRTIWIDAQGVHLCGYLGRRARHIEWSGAHAAIRADSVHVCGSDGTQIEHSKWHCGRHSFVFELEKHIKVY